MDANAYKAKGNEAFSAKNFPAAIEAFTQAIALDGSNHVLYSNRSASYASLNQYKEALEDAEKCVSLNGSWAKGYIRLGAALHGLRLYDKAIEAYEKGLKVEPSNATLQAGIQDVKQDKEAALARNPFAKIFNKECIPKIQANPNIAPYMMHPDLVAILAKIIEKPETAQEYMKDKRIMHIFMELSGIHVPVGDEDDEPAKPAPKPQPKKQEAPPAPVGNPEALKLKDEGNELYKQRKFDEALEKYDAAFAVDPQTVFLLNRTAVFFEKGEYERCLEECGKALEHGRENKADYTVVAKLMTREAFCMQKLKRYEEAIARYKQALVENRNADTLAKLNACEKEKKKFDEESYYNPELALEKKEEGNAFFKEHQFPKAVECYTESLRRNPKDHAVYSNRAAAYLKLCAYSDALSDCEKCLAINPTFVKAFARKGHAYFWTKEYHKAMEAYDRGLQIDSNNAECLEGRMKTMHRINEMATGDGDEDAAQRAMADPEIQAIMTDTYMQLVLSEMQKDPSRIQEYMKDPGIAGKMQKLIQAGILRFGDGTKQPQQKPAARGGFGHR